MRYLLVFMMLLSIGVVGQAQTATPSPTATMTAFPAGANILTCNGLPCGSLIWTLAPPPVLYSPTPRPAYNDSASPADTATAMSLSVINSVATQSANMLTTTPYITGTPFGNVTANVGTFFTYVRAIQSADFGVLSPLLSFLFLIFTLTISLKLITYVIPIISTLIGLVRKLIELIPGM